MKIDLVCSGGGIKGIALLGAIYTLEKKGFEFVNIGGTSVGAIIASLIQAGYKAEIILEEIKNHLPRFSFTNKNTVCNKILGIQRWMMLYWRLGLYSSDDLEQFLGEFLKKKGISTFLDLPPEALKIVASDITRESIVVFPRDCDEYTVDITKFRISDAVRMSATIPLYFRPRFLTHKETQQKCMIVDGGILSNFPMWLFDKEVEKKARPVIGLQLQSENEENLSMHAPNHALSLMKRVVQTMQTSHDREYIRKKYARNVVFIPVGKIQATDFHLSEKQIDELFEKGIKSCELFLKQWSY